ncbi:MAG: hypothetical protein NVS2B16_37710 [Chloroflexota bacterium]
MLRWRKGNNRVGSFDRDASQFRSLSRHYAGVHPIPVDRIVGSVGRHEELRSDFMPFHTPGGDARYRWIRRAMERGQALPAIEVYQLLNSYYVLDGNHRVAAARRMGQCAIDAVVTEYRPVMGATSLPRAA